MQIKDTYLKHPREIKLSNVNASDAINCSQLYIIIM